MGYGETAGQRKHADQLMHEAFGAIADLLEHIDPVRLREWFEQFRGVFSNTNSRLIDDPIAWSKFLGRQCDLLHEFHLHQKTIAVVGDEMAAWDRRPLSYDQFGSALNGLAVLVTEHTSVLARSIDEQAGHTAGNPRRSLAVAHSVCGLTIVLVAIDQAIKHGDPRDKNCAAMAMFGARLTVSNVSSLCLACEIPIS